jgi:hypothetical protein
MRVICYGLLLAIITSGIPRAEDRPCTGAYRARVVLFLEGINSEISEKIHFGEHYIHIGLEVFLSESTRLLAGLEESRANRKARLGEFAQHWGLFKQLAKSRCRSIQETLRLKFRDRTINLVAMLARALNKHESRRTMHRLLTTGDFSIGKMTDALQAHVDRERLMLSYTGDSLELPPGKLEDVVDITAGSYRVCRAVRQWSPAPCADLEGNRTECESLAAKAMLGKGDCTGDAIRVLSGLSGKKTGVMKKYCEALARQQPEKCLAIPGISKVDAAFCRALAGGGEAACRDPVFSEAASRDCLFDLGIHQVLAGKIPLSAIPVEYKKQELVWPALLAASSNTACAALALGAYDELVASFQLFTSIFR